MSFNSWISKSVLASAVGLAAISSGCAMMHHGEEKEEENEVKVAFDKVPAAAQATFQKESGGATIATVDVESEKGKSIYEADVMLGGKNYEIKVADDGQLISKKLDMEDEKDEKEGKGHEKK